MTDLLLGDMTNIKDRSEKENKVIGVLYFVPNIDQMPLDTKIKLCLTIPVNFSV